MDWMQEALSFPECNITRVRDFAAETDMKMAIAQYNRAVRNLRRDSMDIAIIALRHLSSRYPSFAHAVLLYGCCLMASEQPRGGLKVFENARTETFTDRFRAQAETYLEAAGEEVASLGDDGSERAPDEEFRISPSAPVVQRGNASRRRVRMANSKERRAAAAGSAGPDRIREPFLMRFPLSLIAARAGVVLVGLALLALLVWGGIQLLGPSDREEPNETPTAEQQLSWWMDQMRQAGERGETLDPAALMARWEQEFGDGSRDPTPTTTGTDPVTPSPSPSPSPTPTVTPAPSTEPDYTGVLTAAYDMLEDADSRIGTQPVESLRLLTSLPDVLTGVPDGMRASGVPLSAAEIREERDAMIAEYRWVMSTAARVEAEGPWQARDFETAMVYYEAIYQVYPTYYTGYVAFRLGLCFEQVGAVDRALECYNTVLEIGPKSPQYPGANARIAALT